MQNLGGEKGQKESMSRKNWKFALLFLLWQSQAKYKMHLHRLNIQTPVMIVILFLVCLQGKWRWSEWNFWGGREMKRVANVLREDPQIKLITFSVLLGCEAQAVWLPAVQMWVLNEISCNLHIQFIFWSCRMRQKPVTVTRGGFPVQCWPCSWHWARLFHGITEL